MLKLSSKKGVYNYKHINQFIIFDETKVTFKSYQSIVAVVEDDAVTLGIDWDYSQTTLRHLYMFLDEYANNIYQLISNKPNKKQAIKQLIDDKIIKYDENLR